MKKWISLASLFLVITLLNGCGYMVGMDENASEEMLIKGREQVAEELAILESMDWKDLNIDVDVADSIRNSNLMNGGHLVVCEDGKICFWDYNAGGICISGPKGEEKRLLEPEKGGNLQVSGGWLFYNPEDGGIKRIDLNTGVVEYMYEEACGEFVLKDDKIYVSTPQGLCTMTLDGMEITVLRENNPFMAASVCGDDFWFGNAAKDEDVSLFLKGYLLGYDEEQNKLYYMEEGKLYPLIAGKWLSVFDNETVTRHVWNLETGTDTDLKIYDQRVLCDGNSLYYVTDETTQFRFFRWDGEKAESVFTTEASGVPHKYLAPEYLYWIQHVEVEKEIVVEWWYYNLETGEMGQFS